MKQDTNKLKSSDRRLIWQFLRGSRGLFALSMLSSAVAALADMISPQIVRVAVDNALGGQPAQLPGAVLRLVERLGGFPYLGKHLGILALALICVALVKVLAQYLYEVSKTRAAETLVKNMRDGLFSHIERLPFSWHMQNSTGDIIQRCTSDIDTLKNFISEQMTSIVRILILLVLSVTFMLSMDPRLTWIAMLPVPAIIFYSIHFHHKIREDFLKCDENEGVLSTMAQENLTGVRVVRAFGQERRERDRFEKQNRYYTSLWIRLGRPMAAFWSIGDVLSGIQVLLTLVFGALYCLRGRMTPGELIAFLSYVALMTWPVRMLGRMISEMSKAGVSLDRIQYIMDAEEEKKTGDGLTPELDRDIDFSHVSFSYDGKTEVLKDVSFSIPAGSTLGILGGTGSGKSTLMLLLDKLYELGPEQGSIRIGGTDLRDIQTDYLRHHIGMVLQEPFLFSRTIAENIGIQSPDMELKVIREAARAACLDQTVMSFAKGYDTFVGERGVTLSGGQKQRAAIARTLTRKTPILIFDDSLSAVDSQTDAKIRASLESRFGTATTILISHRITTLSKADQILVLDHGRIAEQGSHEELKNAGGIYQQICQIQSGGEGETA